MSQDIVTQANIEDAGYDADIDFANGFRPTDEQVAYASKYAQDFNLDSVFVAVNFPGKEYGIWLQGQTREPVLEAGLFFALWNDRNSALEALETKRYGNAVFRVYADGHIGAAIELI